VEEEPRKKGGDEMRRTIERPWGKIEAGLFRYDERVKGLVEVTEAGTEWHLEVCFNDGCRCGVVVPVNTLDTYLASIDDAGIQELLAKRQALIQQIAGLQREASELAEEMFAKVKGK